MSEFGAFSFGVSAGVGLAYLLMSKTETPTTVFRCHDCDRCYSTPDGEMIELPIGLCPRCSKRIQAEEIEREKFRERGDCAFALNEAERAISKAKGGV